MALNRAYLHHWSSIVTFSVNKQFSFTIMYDIERHNRFPLFNQNFVRRHEPLQKYNSIVRWETQTRSLKILARDLSEDLTISNAVFPLFFLSKSTLGCFTRLLTISSKSSFLSGSLFFLQNLTAKMSAVYSSLSCRRNKSMRQSYNDWSQFYAADAEQF